MFNHWMSVSGTRKLNHHYQGEFLTPLEWWRGIIVAGFGCSYDGTLTGLTFRTDGCYVGNANYGGSMVIPAKSLGQSTFNTFVPFYVMDLGPVTINGVIVPDLLQYNLTDSTGKLKVIKTNITFYWYDAFNVEQHVTRSCYVFGYELSDMPVTQYGFDSVTISDAKFTDLKWKLPYNSPVKCGVTSGDFNVMWQDSNYNYYEDTAVIHFTRDLLDETVSYGFGAPDIGSGMSFGNTLQLNYSGSNLEYYSKSLGACRFGYVDSNDIVRLESVFQPLGMNGTAELDYGQLSGYPTTSNLNIKCVCSEFTCDYGFLINATDSMMVDYVEHDVNALNVVSIR